MPKNPAAVALGRLGGLKGGHARAKKLSAKRLSEIGRKASRARMRKVIPKRRRGIAIKASKKAAEVRIKKAQLKLTKPKRSGKMEAK